MQHFLYIIHSKNINKYYIGESSNVEQRLILHNEHYFKKSFTKTTPDWQIQLTYSCNNKKDAQFLERFIKKMKSRKFILKIIENPYILDDILRKKT